MRNCNAHQDSVIVAFLEVESGAEVSASWSTPSFIASAAAQRETRYLICAVVLMLPSVLAKNAGLFIMTLATVIPMHDVLWATTAQTIAGRRGMQAPSHVMRIALQDLHFAAFAAAAEANEQLCLPTTMCWYCRWRWQFKCGSGVY